MITGGIGAILTTAIGILVGGNVAIDILVAVLARLGIGGAKAAGIKQIFSLAMKVFPKVLDHLDDKKPDLTGTEKKEVAADVGNLHAAMRTRGLFRN